MITSVRKLFHSGVLHQAAMDLRSLIGCLEAVVPSARAESWDNTGLLVEPSGNPSISRVLLTIDLTEQVLEEALGVRAGLVVAYHPPIFQSLKRLTQGSSKERIVVRALENRVAVYSPHTALDCMKGGVNDWLLAGLGQGKVETLSMSSVAPSPSSTLSISGVDKATVDSVTSALPGLPLTCSPTCCRDPQLYDLQVLCSKEEVSSFLMTLNTLVPDHKMSLQTRPLIPVTGGGRKLCLNQPVSISELVFRVKTHLSISHVRLAKPPCWKEEKRATTVVVCAGSGGNVLAGTEADVYLTGEMSHHDILAATSRGIAVILCEHSNTERGFLDHYRLLLKTKTGPGVTISLAQSDSEPLVVA
jgi:dinuclear metal center YbgI/SA1388 family protein